MDNIKIEIRKLADGLDLTKSSDCAEFYKVVAARFGKLGLSLEAEQAVVEAAAEEVEGHYLLALDC